MVVSPFTGKYTSCLLFLQGLVDAGEGVFQLLLGDDEGQVGAGALQHGAQRVAGASQAAGNRVGVVEGDQLVVDFVHHAQQGFGVREFACAQQVQHIASALRGGFGDAVEVRADIDAQFVGFGQRVAQHDGVQRLAFHEFLLGVLQEARVVDLRERAQLLAGVADLAVCLRQQFAAGVELVAVQAADGAGAELGRFTAGLEPLLTRVVARVHLLAQLLGDLAPVVHGGIIPRDILKGRR